MDNNNILQKLEGLESRYEEVSTLITDPDVIADQSRYVKLTKEYKDLGDIMAARKRYIDCLNAIKEAKDILANESDPDMKEMAREELNENEALQPQLEEEIKIALVPKTQKMPRTYKWKFVAELVATKPHSLLATSSICTRNSASQRDGLSA